MGNLTLAITTIGDLLLNNKITRKMDGKPIENIRLTIPEYQRPYKWTARNAIQLLDDIIEAKNDNKEVYRVGTLILHKDKEKDGNYNIVDGQQRTITFALLLYSLYYPEDYKEYPIKAEDRITFLNQVVFDNSHSRRNIANNRQAFKRRINKGGEDKENPVYAQEMLNLRNFIETRCELVVVVTEDISEAFQFFDSQNARGKALYPHDLLKAYHLREMTDIDETRTDCQGMGKDPTK